MNACPGESSSHHGVPGLRPQWMKKEGGQDPHPLNLIGNPAEVTSRAEERNQIFVLRGFDTHVSGPKSEVDSRGRFAGVGAPAYHPD